MKIEVPSISVNETELMKNFRINIKKSMNVYQFRSKFDIDVGGENKSIDLVCYKLQANIMKLTIHMHGSELHANINYDIDIKFSVSKMSCIVTGIIGGTMIDEKIKNVKQVQDMLRLFIK